MTDPARETLSLVIADDHAVVRKGLAAFIETAPDIRLVAMAASGAEAVDAVASHRPDVALLDLLLPDAPAEATVARIKAAHQGTAVVIITSHEGMEAVRPVMRAGALSYLLKDTLPADLIEAIREAGRGRRALSPQVARALLAETARTRREPPLHETLTARELEVLRLIAEGAPNAEIALRCGISNKTVKSHVGSILSKLYVADRTQAAVYAWREGIMS
ncbi:MAG: response regulator transcription factor [Pseudomonadota bacterium]